MNLSQQIQFLGLQVDSKKMKIFLPEEKVQNIMQTCQQALTRGTLSIRQLSQLLGKLNVTSQAMLSAPVCYHQLQQLKIQSFRRSRSFDTLVTLDQRATEELIWWRDQLRNGKDVIPPPPDMLIETDASMIVWGAVCQGIRTGGPWSHQERDCHINVLELSAATYVSSTDACEGQPQHSKTHSSKKGQYLGTDVCRPDGGDALSRLDEGGLFTLGLVFSEGNHSISIPLARSLQCDCRSGIQRDTDVSRVDAPQGTVLRSQQVLGTFQHTSVCQQTEPSTEQVYQLEARSRGNEQRCLPDQLEEPRRIYLPTLCLDRQMFTEDKDETEYNSADCPSLVPGPVGTSHGSRSCWKC